MSPYEIKTVFLYLVSIKDRVAENKEKLDANEKQLLSLFRELSERNQRSIIESVKELVEQQNSAELGKDTISDWKSDIGSWYDHDGCSEDCRSNKYS